MGGTNTEPPDGNTKSLSPEDVNGPRAAWPREHCLCHPSSPAPIAALASSSQSQPLQRVRCKDQGRGIAAYSPGLSILRAILCPGNLLAAWRLVERLPHLR